MTPKIIGDFLDVKANGGYPLKIRTDYGTENGHDSSKAVLLLWIFVLQVFVMLSCASVFFMAGKGLSSWLSFVISNSDFVAFPLISWVRCGTWSLSSSLLLCTCSSILSISKAHRSWWWQTIHICVQVQVTMQILRAGGDIYERNTSNFWLNCLSTYCTRQREFHWRHFGQKSCIVLFQIINLGKV